MAEMDINQVLKYLPQRYPVLMIDRVKEKLKAHEKGVGEAPSDQPVVP